MATEFVLKPCVSLSYQVDGFNLVGVPVVFIWNNLMVFRLDYIASSTIPSKADSIHFLSVGRPQSSWRLASDAASCCTLI